MAETMTKNERKIGEDQANEGAPCPACKHKMAVVATDEDREQYLNCKNRECPLFGEYSMWNGDQRVPSIRGV